MDNYRLFALFALAGEEFQDLAGQRCDNWKSARPLVTLLAAH
jgi:hypothetical protein